MSTMTITIERTPRTLKVKGSPITVEELSIRLPFGRKSVNIDELCATGNYRVFVSETRILIRRSAMRSRCSRKLLGAAARNPCMRAFRLATSSASARPATSSL